MTALCCGACAEFYHPHFSEVRELTVTLDSLNGEYPLSRTYIDVSGGDAYLNVYSNGKVNVRMLEDVSWARLIGEGFENDGKVGLNMDANESYRRMAEVEVELDGTGLRDTLRFYQYGIVPHMECYEPFLAVDGREGMESTFPVITNILPDDIVASLEYDSSEKGWMEYVVESDGKVTVNVNKSMASAVSSAKLFLSFPDGWKSKVGVVLRVTRSDKDGAFGQSMSFADVRSMASETGTLIDKDIFIEGLVVSDCKSHNMELNPNLAYNKVDTLENARTAYIQSLDSPLYGFRLKFDDARENVLTKGTRMMISLKNAVVTRESDPERYTISSLTSDNMQGGTYGNEIPSNPKSISQLTDADIYTYVEIENTEFLNKVGSYANVKEEFSLPSSFNDANKLKAQMDGWASLLADGNGDAIYAMVNMLCPWRRLGDGVPQGTGSVKGIIVHHDHKRYGPMGDYQIRVLDVDGFCQAAEGDSNYENLHLWGFFESGAASKLPSSNDGAAMLYLENEDNAYAPSTCQSFNALTAAGTGVVSRMAFRVRGNVSGWYEWGENGQVADYRGLRMEFSTQSLPEDSRLYAYINFAANGTDASPLTEFKNFPAHWCLKYSVDGERYEIVPPVTGAPDEDYVHLRSAPWTSTSIGNVKYYTGAWCGMGFTEHLFALPQEIVGHEKVYVRLCPYDTCRYMISADWEAPVETGEIYQTTLNNNDIRFSAIQFLVKKQ